MKQQLVITNPCTENWDEMTPSNEGRYCTNCTKHVIDLTTKTDAELMAFFKKKSENVCGRLRTDQLNRTLAVPAKKTNWHWLFPVAVGASAIIPATEVVAQNVTTTQNVNANTSDQKKTDNQLTALNKTEIIRGKVVTENGTPLVGVKVRMNSFRNVVAVTDTAGVFELRYERNGMSGKLSFEALGFQKLDKEITSNMVVTMKAIRIMLGAVAVLTNDKPLYIITSGKKSCIADENQQKLVKAEWIEGIDVLKDASATALYGIKAANGVIIMKIKKQYANKIDFSKKL